MPVILDSLPWTYTAGMFRTTRFGVAEAHGLGMVLQANYLLEKRRDRDHRRRTVPAGARALRGRPSGTSPTSS